MSEEKSNSNEGRTVLYRGQKGEIVLSSSFKEDDFNIMSDKLKEILDVIVIKGGDVSYVD